MAGAGTAAHAVLGAGIDGEEAEDGHGPVQLHLVVDLQHLGDLDLHGAVVAAVAAAGAGHVDLAPEHVAGLLQNGGVLVAEGAAVGKGRYVVDDLLHVAHAAEDHLHVVQAHQPAEGPGGDGPVGMGGLQHFVGLGGEAGQTPAAAGLHDDDGDARLGQGLILALGVLHGPVQIVQLDLGEIPLVGSDHFFQHGDGGMGAEAQLLDPSLFLLLDEVLQAAPAKVALYAVFVHDAVHQIEVDVVGVEALQLLLEHGLVVRVGPGHVLGGQLEAGAVILGQHLAQEVLAPGVDIGGVEVGDAVLHGVVDDLGSLVEVDGRAMAASAHGGQAHVAHAQTGDGFALEILADHLLSSLFIYFIRYIYHTWF